MSTVNPRYKQVEFCCLGWKFFNCLVTYFSWLYVSLTETVMILLQSKEVKSFHLNCLVYCILFVKGPVELIIG